MAYIDFPTAYVRVASQTYVLQHICLTCYHQAKPFGLDTKIRSYSRYVDNRTVNGTSRSFTMLGKVNNEAMGGLVP